MITHKGGCHCGRVRFEVTAPGAHLGGRLQLLHVLEIGLPVSHRAEIAVQAGLGRRGSDRVQVQHGNGGASLLPSVRHQVVLRAALAPDGYSVNARCLDEGTVEEMTVIPKDGKNWEKTYASKSG